MTFGTSHSIRQGSRPTDVPLHRVRILPQSREDARFFALRRERKETKHG